MVQVPTVTFNDGKKIPVIGLGTLKSTPAEVIQAVKDAIDVGYRHIDCAHVYENEKEVGAAIAAKIAEGVVKREDLFITSKLWNTFHRPEAVEPAFRRCLKELGVDYLDLYLLHWPMGFKEGDDLNPADANGIIPTDYDYVDTWKAIEEVYKKGLIKSIGISNFNKKQIERILEVCTVVPVTNQIECHPYLDQRKLSDFCYSKGITITAYSPIGAPGKARLRPEDTKPIDDKIVKDLAVKYNKTPAQILLRYQIQRNHIIIPKTVSKKRMIENISIFDFELAEKDVALLGTIDCNGRSSPFSLAKRHKFYPFHDEY
uniref:NADP-dependent oxidoreductase domain-containing protein n=1 Tax=Photinus pyralis TaxID=7054 RepID=A0A1Y1LLL2_PHOPY